MRRALCPSSVGCTTFLRLSQAKYDFAGVVLRDLAMSSELPTYLDPSCAYEPANATSALDSLREYADPTAFAGQPSLPEYLPQRPLINVHKYRVMASTIQKVMTFKEIAACYPYEPNLPIYRKCLNLHSLPLALITKLSLMCE